MKKEVCHLESGVDLPATEMNINDRVTFILFLHYKLKKMALTINRINLLEIQRLVV